MTDPGDFCAVSTVGQTPSAVHKRPPCLKGAVSELAKLTGGYRIRGFAFVPSRLRQLALSGQGVLFAVGGLDVGVLQKLDGAAAEFLEGLRQFAAGEQHGKPPLISDATIIQNGRKGKKRMPL